MQVIGGIIFTIACTVAGYTMHHGDLGALNQPHEYIIIGGAALGSMITGTPIAVIKAMIAQFKGLFGKGPSKQDYIELLTLMYEMFQIAQKQGLLGWEEHINDPEKSSVFKKYESFLHHHHAVEFMTDTMKVIVSGSAEPHDLEGLMETDLDTAHKEEGFAPSALTTVSDGMPAVGIIAAVLGIVITMGNIDGPPAVIGMSVASALVGTLFGIFLAYCVLGPIAKMMEARNEANHKYVECIMHALLAHVKGVSPAIAVEFARRATFSTERPTFDELEQACRAAKG